MQAHVGQGGLALGGYEQSPRLVAVDGCLEQAELQWSLEVDEWLVVLVVVLVLLVGRGPREAGAELVAAAVGRRLVDVHVLRTAVVG
eukprot:scaffold74035_cov50-Phaeocystis_antarctica.AAC.1